ncbi:MULTISPECIES: ABC transporter permease [Paraburkholderia]|jgi:oligopeptide transport system permease protein|uniref:Oligopeptide transport system permease protein OppC n=1 Tax=Paraburkholderia aspalathi TaxID=1324617 RepID=A0A1I7CS92_9BURK|nr:MULTISPECIES: ABC transporter permease subunit [Paraburkholderia]MBK3840259.1 ABC transporter permease subunit [Paraburkholderia aspalathi]MCX4158392.1 ABC transporter permease subunit [Paraburkholderia aspalathi]MDN7167793.1 ABC transporter permease subunit [Paraburkholderia sp. SECH2]MDQ6396281.1 ABC transporter permease subunit [Paraburkholderia aspalathi]CAE6752477.1 Oligopeptide transport system permease protein OppC [Paraburkholderia aspalathi]
MSRSFQTTAAALDPLAAIANAPRSRGPLATAAARFVRNRAAFTGFVVLLLIVIACVAGPWFLPNNPIDSDWSAISLAPTLQNMHWFGTDELGRDLLARTLQGGRVSLEVGLLGTLVSGLIGVAYGATAGYLGGRVDAVMMRIVDMMYAIPYMLIAILMMTLFGRAFYLVVLTISAFSWLDMARVVRGQTLSLRSREFIDAARAIGVSSRSIIARHIVPNLFGVVVVYASVTVPNIVLTESVLSFLGLGVQEPMTSWGVLIQDGAQKLDSMPWLLLCPAVMLCITLYSVNFVGDGLRDAFDPKDR